MRRLSLLAVVLILAGLAACGDKAPRAPFTDSRIPPGIEERFNPPPGWAWGVFQVPGAPPSRYGVAAPPFKARGHLVVMPGYGESAEVWLETAADLVERGYAVWILDGVAQGGSGRYVEPRDLGHAKPGEADVRALEFFLKRIVRARPVTVLASGSAAAPALLAAETGAPIDRLILSAPDAPEASPRSQWLKGIGLERLRASGGAWSRRAPPAGEADPRRAAAAHQWQVANPDLRMGGPSQGWAAAHAETSRKARAGLFLIKAPMLVVAGRDAAAFCRRVPRCEARNIDGLGARPHLAREAPRDAWLAVIAGPDDPHRDGFSRPPREARVHQ